MRMELDAILKVEDRLTSLRKAVKAKINSPNLHET